MKDINDILAKHFSRETSPEEEANVQEWKKENEEEYDILFQAWNQTTDFKLMEYNDEQAWSKIEGSLVENTQRKVFNISFFIKYAAAASVLLVLGIGLMWVFSNATMIEVKNDTSQVKELNLPDGSSIWLAPDTRLKYNENFKENRNLQLHGIAFFEVERDELNPFVISTKNGEIEVLGTAFNINADSIQTIVSVDHGLVALRRDKEEIKLGQNEMAISSSSGISSKKDVSLNYQAWRTGKFTFDSTPLRLVVEELNRYYNNKIELQIESDSLELTAQFDKNSLDEVIEIIVLTCGIEANKNNEKIVLK